MDSITILLQFVIAAITSLGDSGLIFFPFNAESLGYQNQNRTQRKPKQCKSEKQQAHLTHAQMWVEG